jgi:hypothetical protein
MNNESVTVPATSDPAGGPTVMLQPGQTQTFTATWNPGADDGSTPAPAGTYIVITITLKNMTKTSRLFSLDAATDGITVLQGSTVIAKSPLTAKTRIVKPGKSLQHAALWNGKPNQAGVPKISAGIYTIEFDEGVYSAAGQIRID